MIRPHLPCIPEDAPLPNLPRPSSLEILGLPQRGQRFIALNHTFFPKHQHKPVLAQMQDKVAPPPSITIDKPCEYDAEAACDNATGDTIETPSDSTPYRMMLGLEHLPLRPSIDKSEHDAFRSLFTNLNEYRRSHRRRMLYEFLALVLCIVVFSGFYFTSNKTQAFEQYRR